MRSSRQIERAHTQAAEIEGIRHVINYEVPSMAEAYVHRKGRPGRAEAAGTAVALIVPEAMPALRALARALQIDLATALARAEPSR